MVSSRAYTAYGPYTGRVRLMLLLGKRRWFFCRKVIPVVERERRCRLEICPPPPGMTVEYDRIEWVQDDPDHWLCTYFTTTGHGDA